MKVRFSRRRLIPAAVCLVLAGGGMGVLVAADHDDSPLIGGDQAADIADVYAFRSPADEDRVIQAYVAGDPANQVMHVRGPIAPVALGPDSRIVNDAGVTVSARVSTGTQVIVGERQGVRLFAGVRDDPFFFDLGRFSAILAGQASSFADPGTDAFAGLNTYAIVIELPVAMIGDPATTTIWASTSR